MDLIIYLLWFKFLVSYERDELKLKIKTFLEKNYQEIDPTPDVSEDVGEEGAKSMFQELSSAIPGIDEAMSFAEVMK